MARSIRPTCRYCHARVEFFGDVCAPCAPDHDPDAWEAHRALATPERERWGDPDM